MLDHLTKPRLSLFLAGFSGVWVCAWVLARSLPTGSSASAWFMAEIIAWAVYSLVFWRQPSRERITAIGLGTHNAYRGLVWGLAVGAVWSAVLIAAGGIRGSHWAPNPVTLRVLGVIVLGPIIEEMIFRGYIFATLTSFKWSFFRTNIVTSALFVSMHVLGWAFLGTFRSNTFSAYPLSLFLVSLLAGHVRHRSHSLIAAVLIHSANNIVTVWLV